MAHNVATFKWESHWWSSSIATGRCLNHWSMKKFLMVRYIGWLVQDCRVHTSNSRLQHPCLKFQLQSSNALPHNLSVRNTSGSATNHSHPQNWYIHLVRKGPKALIYLAMLNLATLLSITSTVSSPRIINFHWFHSKYISTIHITMLYYADCLYLHVHTCTCVYTK